MDYLESLLSKIPSLNYNPIFKMFREDITFEFILKLIIIYFFIVWIAIVVWVIKDIWNRTDSILFQILCILIVLILTPLWVFLYILIRPSKTLFEKYYEEIEDNLDVLSTIIKDKINTEQKVISCLNCNEEIEQDFSFCPNCKSEIKSKCKWCSKEIRIWWKICPFCWDEQEDKIDKNFIDETKNNENKTLDENNTITTNKNSDWINYNDLIDSKIIKEV